MTAAEHLKAELVSRMPLGRSAKGPSLASTKESKSDFVPPDSPTTNELVGQPSGGHSPSETPVDVERVQLTHSSTSVLVDNQDIPRMAADTEAQDSDADRTSVHDAGADTIDAQGKS